ncbi:MAG: sulfite exporter TauE/SafE family protein [Phycisphaeraceae bacterium]|nr:sulfite exporter TauE/SafE family protein [Phycisphaeraceae bacterium]MCB9848322.1 sulfite exporter TauE/SafE family protein [Phycisphaeraceae bacterium]
MRPSTCQPPIRSRTSGRGSIRPFLFWLGLFYGGWLTLVIVGSLWGVIEAHWPIAAAMAVGSYFAGSTPMGGGTVGFPVLVLLLGEPATLGRDFSLAVQSVGMVSASIFIFATRRPLEWTLLKWAMIGTIAGAPLGAAFVAPHVSDLQIKLLFAVIWCSFGVMNLVKLRSIVAAEGITATSTGFDKEIGILIGLLGGVAASITGVGIDMILYAALVLVYRADLKIAVPTSVVAMAFASLVGLASHGALGSLDGAVFGHWIAAAPIVVVGAPLGAWVVSRIPRTPTMLVVSALCVGQFVWTIVNQRVGGWWLGGALGGVLVFNLVFHLMHGAGSRLSATHRHLHEPGSRPPI